MKTIFPDYFENFKCIAEKCRHNCCIGWEIDIDPQTLACYQSAEGEFGKRLRKNISLEGTPHFILGENERCPFLNKKNLCDIFINLGESKLCSICTEHPRFYNTFDTHNEAGLGLCCEEAARLIITDKTPFKLNLTEEMQNEVTILREKIFQILQDYSKDIYKRTENMLSLFFKESPQLSLKAFLPVFEKLERLDEDWSTLLSSLNDFDEEKCEPFRSFMKERESEYEQFLCYLIYRHFSKSATSFEMALYSLFAVLCFKLVFAMGERLFSQNGNFTTENQLEIMRLFSSEIEYSDENIDIILDELEALI
ncbi:MAG: flagellin lysine-N-methylase [Clostridia bacterium]|nr:flagellin lysine-N-methylase [Clostridia bacterium]